MQFELNAVNDLKVQLPITDKSNVTINDKKYNLLNATSVEFSHFVYPSLSLTYKRKEKRGRVEKKSEER